MVNKCPKIFKGREGFKELQSKGFTRSISRPNGAFVFSTSKTKICELANKNKGKVKILEFKDNHFTLIGDKKIKRGFVLKQ